MDRALYWTHFERYSKCPQMFLWYHGWRGVDVGGGFGKKKPLPTRRSEHDLLMGTVTQASLERFYNDELWKNPKGYLDHMERLTETIFDQELNRRYIDWELSPTKEEMLKVCMDGVLGYLKTTMKRHKLLGPYARSEVEMLGWIKGRALVACRIDFIIRDRQEVVSILEGKNSKYKGKYIDRDQIRWAALCYWLSWRRLPDRLGYDYWRFPTGYMADGLSEPEDGIEWVPFTTDDIKAVSARALRTWYAMNDKNFQATPKPQHCRFCDYVTLCSERADQRSLNAAQRRSGDDDLVITPGGFVELDLDD